MVKRKWIKISILTAVISAALFIGIYVLVQNARKNAPSYERHMAEILQMEQTDLTGTISGIRTGITRTKTGCQISNEMEYTDQGIYILAQDDDLGVSVNGILWPAGTLFYADHSSDTFVKLCGRPDCTHDTFDCNAIIPEVYGGISYYDGHLYYTVEVGPPSMTELWRMDPDGTNRVCILSCETVNYDGKYTGFGVPHFMNGVFIAPLHYLDEESEFGYRTDWYYCKLDGFSTELKLMPCGRGWNDGETFLVGSRENEEDETWELKQWDPDSNQLTLITELTLSVTQVTQGYWGVDTGYYHWDGELRKVNYTNGSEEVLFETGITGEYMTRYYPDCIAVYEVRDYEAGDYDIIHFFSWDGKDLGTVTNDFAPDMGVFTIMEETKDRIFCLGNIRTHLPEYYIEKSDLGTGHIEVHRYHYLDLTEEKLLNTFGED